MSTIYQHPDGGSIALTDTTLTVSAENGHAAAVEIGPDGLRDLAKKLMTHAADFEYALHLESLSHDEVLRSKRQKIGTPAQIESMSDHEYLHRISKLQPIVKVNIISQRPTIKNLGEMVQDLCNHQHIRGGTRISAFSEADYNGIHPEEPDQIELTIEGETLALDNTNAVEIHIRENVSVHTVRAILKAVRRELKSWPGLESVTPLVPVPDEDLPF